MMYKFMEQAFEQALMAQKSGEIPVGCVIVLNNEIIARGHNQREVKQDATAHAEIVAIREACKKLNNWRLSQCHIYVTLEPCLMCAGAIIAARMSRLFFSAYGEDDLSIYKSANIEIYGGIMLERGVSLISRKG